MTERRGPYRARQAEALAALDTADSYRQTLYATERGALRALDLDGALTLAGQAGDPRQRGGGCPATGIPRVGGDAGSLGVSYRIV
ncbi:hypothetical protein Tamer19_42750 [Cupriavidus sp. TA19]|nr:hypothetical protein Tamer19_42750 [Cupriavidus sp. TA19]